MDFLEKDLEEIIFNANTETLQERGLEVCGKRFRQLKIGNYGIADMVTFERIHSFKGGSFIMCTVYELKKDKIGISAFLQAVNYVQGIKTYFKKRNKRICVTFKIVLVGRTIDTSGSMCFLPNLFYRDAYYCPDNGIISDIEFYTYKYSIDGIEFLPECDYNLTNTGF